MHYTSHSLKTKLIESLSQKHQQKPVVSQPHILRKPQELPVRCFTPDITYHYTVYTHFT